MHAPASTSLLVTACCRSYEGTIPVFIHGDTSQPHLAVEVSGQGRFPRLTFDVPEVVLPPVSVANVVQATSIARACPSTETAQTSFPERASQDETSVWCLVDTPVTAVLELYTHSACLLAGPPRCRWAYEATHGSTLSTTATTTWSSSSGGALGLGSSPLPS